ncbi:patatin-like phospholipase family protein [Gemmatimonas sp.]|uniref:patatin-like phospholipase family protein n=1 Tax=Gemmatimonas sp. TaxID=1962908 RepID=UPI003F6EE632
MNSTNVTGSKATAPRIAVVLGGGAVKGLAHVGALRAIREAGIVPALYAGSSIGAMIAAAAASGRAPDDLMARALRVRRRDLFRINHMGMLMERMLSRSIYLEAPLRALCDELVDDGTFDSFRHPLLVSAVDLERGLPVVFGRSGFRDVRVRDAVYASCALPGFFPPGVVGNRVCIDGGTMDNLPVSIAGLEVDAIIAVDVGIADVPHAVGVAEQGFATIFMRAASMMMHEMQQATLTRWAGPPMLLVRPTVSHIGWFSFAHVEELLQVGYDATRAALTHLLDALAAPGGIFPRQEMEVTVDRDRCTGCGLCVAHHPALMGLGRDQKAYPLQPVHNFSPADTAFSRCCPSAAITVAPLAPRDLATERLVQSA